MFVSPFPTSPFPTSPYAQNNHVKIERKPEPKANNYLNFLADLGGCGQWRRGFLEQHINLNNLGQSTSLTKMIFDEGWYRDVKTITLQRQASKEQKQFMTWLKEIQPRCGFKLIYEVDDVVFREDIPDYNIFKVGFDNDEIRQNCIDMINMVDEVTVTCKFMRDLYIERTGKKEITAIPNFSPYWWIGHQYDYRRIINSFDKNKKKPRIVYSGSGAHFDVGNKTGQQDDFSHVLKFVIDNRHKYQFVFIGSYPPPLHPYIQNKEIEYHPWQTLMNYPSFLASLDAQLFLAPLQVNNFNNSKSDIKYIEAAQLGIPCMVQNMHTYENALDILKFDTGEDLEMKVEKLLNYKNRANYYKLVPTLREIGSKRFLELPENHGAFLEALNTPYGDPSRKFLKTWN
jgi:hypothetical protein